LRIKQIFYNLLDNAIKFTEEGGINLKVVEEKDCWEFQIIDTGIGIAEEDYEVVFREFGRIEKDLRKDVSGSGIGLALAKRVVHQHGGDIWFNSTEGKGSTFFFTIPKNNKFIK
jgi:two-component system sensor histidine kinase VicK